MRVDRNLGRSSGQVWHIEELAMCFSCFLPIYVEAVQSDAPELDFALSVMKNWRGEKVKPHLEDSHNATLYLMCPACCITCLAAPA